MTVFSPPGSTRALLPRPATLSCEDTTHPVERRSHPPPAHTSLQAEVCKQIGPPLCLLPAPSSFHSRFGSGSSQPRWKMELLGKVQRGRREVCPESREGAEPPARESTSPPSPTHQPSQAGAAPPTSLCPIHSLLKELLQPTGLQHKVPHVHFPQFIMGVTQGLVDEQVYRGGTCDEQDGKQQWWARVSRAQPRT